MRNELIDIADLSDSREVMTQKTPPVIRWFISIIAVLVVISLIFANFAKIDTYVKASGEVRPFDPISTITTQSGGKLSMIAFKDGESVRKGDVLFKFDCNYYYSQKISAENQVREKKSEINQYNELMYAIQNDNNCFDENTHPQFYYQYKNYEIEVHNAISQVDLSNDQTKISLEELELVITQTESLLMKASVSYNDYSEFYITIKNNESYKGDNQTLSDIFQSYHISLNKMKSVYEGYKLQYDSIKKQDEENPDAIPHEQIEQAFYAMNASFADMESVKANLLVQINEIISNLEKEIDNHKSTIENYKSKKEALIQTTNKEEVIHQIKDRYYLSISNSLSSLSAELDSVEKQLLNINETIAQSEIKAEADGVLLYTQLFSIGDNISAGMVLGTIIPTSEKYEVVIYIPEYNIAEIANGQKVEYVFPAISSVDFGKVYGEIIDISKDSFAEQSTGQKFYKSKGTISSTVLISEKGEKRNIQSGMLVEVHAITGEKTILSLLLDKLNFS